MIYKICLFVLVVLLSCSEILSARAPNGPDGISQPEYYTSTNAEGLDSVLILPQPPAINSLEFLVDQARYQEGKTLRNSPAGKQAIDDAIGLKLHEVFSDAFGLQLSKEKTPAIFNLIYSVAGELGDMATRSAKRKYYRTRPYVFYNETTCYPQEEKELANNGSYPSGHSARGWGLALILAEINPANKEAILKRGFDIGQSRVICGYHWQSDVDAGRLAGAAGVATLQANPKFRANLEEAKKEFASLKKENKSE